MKIGDEAGLEAEIKWLKEQVESWKGAHSVAAADRDILKEKFRKAKEWNQFCEIELKNLRSIVESQNDLLIRAADALEAGWPTDGELDRNDTQLIAELRKAAK